MIGVEGVVSAAISRPCHACSSAQGTSPQITEAQPCVPGRCIGRCARCRLGAVPPSKRYRQRHNAGARYEQSTARLPAGAAAQRDLSPPLDCGPVLQLRGLDPVGGRGLADDLHCTHGGFRCLGPGSDVAPATFLHGLRRRIGRPIRSTPGISGRAVDRAERGPDALGPRSFLPDDTLASAGSHIRAG